MKRNYPLIMIDRSKHSTYPFDYITCLDSEVGFVARVVIFKDNATLKAYAASLPNLPVKPYVLMLKNGGIALIIEGFIYEFELTTANVTRVNALLKKALKKYFFATSDREPDEVNLSIDNQIKQQQLSIDRAKSNYDELVRRSPNPASADYSIRLAEATLDSLKMLRNIVSTVQI